MLYLHDVWLNWIDGAIKGYQVPEFFEWHKEDKVDIMDQMPLFKVKEGFFTYIEDGINELPADLIETVKDQAYKRENNKKIRKSAFVVTDGKRILAVDPEDGNTPGRKSRLIPRQEELVFEMVHFELPMKFEYTSLPGSIDDFTIPPEIFMFGLTRTEREKKSLLFEAILLGSADANVFKVRYWYSEWNYNNVENVKELSFVELSTQLVKEVSLGWDYRHENLLKITVKGNPYLEIKYSEIVGRSKKDGKKKLG